MDYGKTGLTIQEAMVDHLKRFPNKADRPDFILWNGVPVKTGDAFSVTPTGIVRGEIISTLPGLEQGFDLKVSGGLTVSNGVRVPLLRTWYDPECEPVVEYPFECPDGRIHTWNVYRIKYSDREVEERWTGNAGFWVEPISELERIYHCSHGLARQPDFSCLIYKVTVICNYD